MESTRAYILRPTAAMQLIASSLVDTCRMNASSSSRSQFTDGEGIGSQGDLEKKFMTGEAPRDRAGRNLLLSQLSESRNVASSVQQSFTGHYIPRS